MGGSGYWRASAGDEDPGAKPARQPGDEYDGGPVDAARPAETDSSSKGWTYKPTGSWLNLDRLSDEALLQAQGYDLGETVLQSRSGRAEAAKHADTPTGDEPGAPAQRGSGELGYTLEDFDPRLHRPDRQGAPREQAVYEQTGPEQTEQQPKSDRVPRESAEAVERFEPRQANLPEVSREDAGEYIRDNGERRPWLKLAEHSPADVQHVVAAVDQGGGHALDRHEGYTAGERLERRVGGLEDPAQLNSELRAQGLDARKPDKLHPCKETGTSIDDPGVFAAAFARGVEHPNMRDTLGRPREPYENPPPDAVEIPISELLGEDGHQHCAGYRLVPIDGDLNAAKDNRKEWARSSPEERQHMTQPQTEPIPAEDFQSGTIVFSFRATEDYSRWEVASMFPKPRDRNEQQP